MEIKWYMHVTLTLNCSLSRIITSILMCIAIFCPHIDYRQYMFSNIIKKTQIIPFEELFTLFIFKLVSLMNKAAQNENLYLKENPENCVQSRRTDS